MPRKRRRTNHGNKPPKPAPIDPFTYAEYLTPEEAYQRTRPVGVLGTLEEYKAKAAAPAQPCENECGNVEWKFGMEGLCFACTTGETDASEDYELR